MQIRGFKSLGLFSVLLVAMIVIGGMIIFKMWDEDRAEERAWQQVLDSDFQSSVHARQALGLVARLEKLQKDHPGGSPEIDGVEQRIASAWPNFGLKDGDGRLKLPSAPTMRRLLKRYIRRG